MVAPSRPELDGLTWPHAAASRFVEANGLRWHVQQLGTGPAIVLIHGTGASSHSWEGVVDALKADFTLTVVDLPGHGFTQALHGAGMSLPSLAGHLGRLLAVLGVAPRMLVGHSAGAAIAVRMALDGPGPSPDVIVAVNGALLPWNGVARWLFPPLARLLASGPLVASLLAGRANQAGAVSRMLAGTGKLPPARSVAYYERMLRRPSQVQAVLDMMAHWDLERLAADLPHLGVPLALIACGEDAAVPADMAFAVKAKVPSAHVHYIRKLGHLAHEEQPLDIAAVIRDAWERHGAGRNGERLATGPQEQP